MRSDLVGGALAEISNRYQLCQMVSKGIRKLHKPTARVEDTATEVLMLLGRSSPSASTQIELEAPPLQQRNAA